VEKMNRKTLTIILTSTWLLFWASSSIAGVTEYQEAVDAYNREDYKTAHKLFLELAEQGVVKAQYKLGLIYGKGKGVAKDYSKAFKWWNLAAEKGNGKAQTNLGWMYEMGKGVPKDAQKAANWYQLASNQGFAKAQEKLNLLLNKTKEFKNLKEKSSKEIKDLQTINAALNSELNQIKSENAKAIEATNQANAKAEQEQLASISDNHSELNTGSVSFRGDALDVASYSEDTFTEVGDYINDSDRLHEAINSLDKKEFVTAHQLFLDLADKGIAEAQINLGMMFESGQGVPQDFNEAIRWYRLAADQKLIKAQEKLNLLLKKAAEAQINLSLGMMFESGQGVPQDFNEAIRWYRLAADQGLIKAQKKLNFLLNKTKENLQENTASSSDNSSELNTGSVSFKEVKLASIKEFENLKQKSSKEIKALQTTTTSLRSELDKIKSDKARAIEATRQANTKAKENKLASIKEFENLKQKSSKEIKALQIKITSLRSEIDKIKSTKARAIEATRQANAKVSEVTTSKDLVSKHLEKWVRAWEKQDIELYLSFYSKEFKGSKERHADWRTSRQAAFKRPTNISIQLQNIQISQNKGTVEINFTQTFKSDGYSDIGIKELVWVKNGSDWRIIKETWMPHK
jgi:TPR repeat protein